MNFNNLYFSPKDTENASPLNGLSVGDVFYTFVDNEYHVFKLLAIEEGYECWHILAYKPINRQPTILDIDTLEVYIYHSPFDKNAFVDGIFLANKTIKADDLIGYHEYLRQTREPDFYIPIANGYYEAGLRLTDEKKHDEAIESYSKAIDLFPQFFEAIDNRAFCKMDLALWEEAIEDFRFSLKQNPISMLAEFSIGECYFNMGDYKNAKLQFEIAQQIDPTHQLPKQFLEKIDKIIGG